MPNLFPTPRVRGAPSAHLSVIAWSAAALAGFCAVAALRVAEPLLLPFAYAAILAVLLQPLACWFDRLGAPEAVSAAAITALVLAVVFAAGYFGARPLVNWIERVPTIVDDARHKLDGVGAAWRQIETAADRLRGFVEDPKEPPLDVSVRQAPVMLTLTASARPAFVQTALAAVLLYFFLATRRDSRRKVLALRSSVSTRLQSGRLLRKVGRNVTRYVLTMTTINAGLGVSVAIGLALIGSPNAAIFGALAAVLNYVPYVGPAILNFLLLASGFVAHDAPLEALAPFGVYAALNFVESNFVTPSLIGAQARVSPLAVIVGVAFFTWLWGPAGGVVAIPLLVMIKTAADETPALRPLSVILCERVGARRSAARAAPSSIADAAPATP